MGNLMLRYDIDPNNKNGYNDNEARINVNDNDNNGAGPPELLDMNQGNGCDVVAIDEDEIYFGGENLIHYLPIEIFDLITSFAAGSPKELLAISLACRALSGFINEDRHWRLIYRRKWGDAFFSQIDHARTRKHNKNKNKNNNRLKQRRVSSSSNSICCCCCCSCCSCSTSLQQHQRHQHQQQHQEVEDEEEDDEELEEANNNYNILDLLPTERLRKNVRILEHELDLAEETHGIRWRPPDAFPEYTELSWKHLYYGTLMGEVKCFVQVYNREDHRGFFRSYFDALAHYKRESATLFVQYLPHQGTAKEPRSESIPFDTVPLRVRAVPAHLRYHNPYLVYVYPPALRRSAKYHQFKKGDEVEVQWRNNRTGQFGWWYGDICDITYPPSSPIPTTSNNNNNNGRRSDASGNNRNDDDDDDDDQEEGEEDDYDYDYDDDYDEDTPRILVKFDQWTERSAWHILRFSHDPVEPQSCFAGGYIGAVRKLSPQERAVMKRNIAELDPKILCGDTHLDAL